MSTGLSAAAAETYLNSTEAHVALSTTGTTAAALHSEPRRIWYTFVCASAWRIRRGLTATATTGTPVAAYEKFRFLVSADDTYSFIAEASTPTLTYYRSGSPAPDVVLPDAPTNVGGTPGDTQATITWDASADDGGAAITSYTATSTPGSFTGTTSDGDTLTVNVTGLTNDVEYTFTVVATNSQGNSAASVASAVITPTA